MKSFRTYLMESARTYKYKIKVAGDAPKTFIQLFCANLQKYDPVSIGEPKSTPIQSDPYGFEGLKDQPVTMFDVEFKYPATEAMIKQLAKLLGHDENLVRMIGAAGNETFANEFDGLAKRKSPLIGNDELEEQPGAKEAAKEYGESYLSRIRKQREEDKVSTGYEGKKEKSAFDPLAPKDEKSISPMTKINLPARPATGARK